MKKMKYSQISHFFFLTKHKIHYILLTIATVIVVKAGRKNIFQ